MATISIYTEEELVLLLKQQSREGFNYLYKQYAWHVRHSHFTVCWPVEITHPSRAGSMSPITCRWFESAAAGSTMLGAPPKDPMFTRLFGADAVIPLDPAPRSAGELRETLDVLYRDRDAHLARALDRRAEHAEAWTWETRVREIPWRIPADGHPRP